MADKNKKAQMHGIEPKKNSKGEIISYKFRCCVGRDEQYKQVWRTCTISASDPRLEGLTPKKLIDELNSIKHEWDKAQKDDYNRTHSKIDKTKLTLVDFINNVWWLDHVMDGSHSPNSISYYRFMAADICEYFGRKKTHLNAINGETVKRYIKYLNTEAKVKILSTKEIPFSLMVKETGERVISWETDKQALSYQIYRYSKRSKDFVQIGRTDDLTYTDEKKAKEPKYQVKALIRIEGDEPISKTTVVRHYQTLRNILNFAQRFDYLKDDPCKKMSVKDKPHQGHKTIDFLEPKDAQRYVAALEQQELYWKCLQNILITCGLRRGEVAGLKYGDINKEKLTLEICRSVTYDKNADNKLRIAGTKTGISRIVSITPRILSMIEALKKSQEGKYGIVLTDESFIFCNVKDPSRPLMPTDVTRWQRKFVDRNRLPDVSPHDLRHSAASLALEAGANLKDVQELLGHQDPETTAEFYAAVTQEAKRRTVTGIENLLIPQIKENEKAE